MGDATPTASDHKLGISTGVSIAPSDINTHTDDFFVTTIGIYTLKLDATTDVIHAFADDLFMATMNILELGTTTGTVILFSPQPMPC
ncbi:hypothetical protein OsI_22837 [Oryza sativa Indica Group]|jgi:hypothetical protein|uniref:Uncharacterized protein n=1 Tax=Oryza sativa subsp. indica TaxID=39946 RepID=A2YCJ6_ORYSI|nr:hypothetical protein OsI_22837 [Oryza sativa Indica Group]